MGEPGQRVNLLHHPDEPDGVGYGLYSVAHRTILFTIRARRMGSRVLYIVYDSAIVLIFAARTSRRWEQ